MFVHRKFTRYIFLFIFFLTMLVGCAQTWSARVTQFEEWPEKTVGATYYVHQTDEQKNNLAYQSVVDAVRAAIGSTGLIQAPEEKARFVVYVNFQNPLKRKWIERYEGPYLTPFGGYWGGLYGPGPWGFGAHSGWTVFPIDVYENTLSIRILDRDQDGKEVYQARAMSETTEEDFLTQISHLAQAVFSDFPGVSGQSRIIEKRIN